MNTSRSYVILHITQQKKKKQLMGLSRSQFYKEDELIIAYRTLKYKFGLLDFLYWAVCI